MDKIRPGFKRFVAGMLAVLLAVPANAGGAFFYENSMSAYTENDIGRACDDETTGGEDIPITTDDETTGGEDIPMTTDDETTGGEDTPMTTDDETSGGEDTPMTTDAETTGGEDIPMTTDAETTGGEDEPQNTYGFILVTSDEDVIDKTGEISPDKAQAWLAENSRDITAIDPDYDGDRYFFIRYNGSYYYLSVEHGHFDEAYFSDNELRWNALTDDEVMDIISALVSSNEQVFIWKDDTQHSVSLTFIEAKGPDCTEAGNIAYWYDPENDRYFSDKNGKNEITKADTVIEPKGHTVGITVIENQTEPSYFHAGGYDEVVYCSECGEEISRQHITVPTLKYKAPFVKYSKGVKSVKLSWEEVSGAEKYGIAGYVNGRWILLYECDDTSFIMDGLTEGKEYWISVIVMSEGRWVKDFSNARNVTPQITAGKYPVLQSVEHNAPTHQFKLNWSAVDGAQQYGIAVYLNGKWKVVTQDIPAHRTSYISPKLKAGQTYTMVICAKVDGRWVTNYLNSRAFTVTVQPEVPLAEGPYESDDFEFSGNVYIVGDSTVCNYKPENTLTKNSCGWGMKLAEQFDNVNVTNLARAGRSSRSFMKDDEYATMCESIGKGDYLFIQFGHNDERTSEPQHSAYPNRDLSTIDNNGLDPNGQYSYEWILLNKYVRVAQQKGATAVLVTPITRRQENGLPDYEGHTEYAEAIIKLGKKYNIPVIDMTTKTKDLYYALYSEGGAEATAELHCYSDAARTTIDNTHLSVKGSEIIAGMIAEETRTLDLKIAERLK